MSAPIKDHMLNLWVNTSSGASTAFRRLITVTGATLRLTEVKA